MGPLTRNGRAAALGAFGFAALSLVGCEAIFTFSPVTFLQTPLENLGSDALGSFGEDALSAGDEEAMKAALNAINEALADPDITPEQAAELSQIGGSLAIELSGVGDLLGDLATQMAAGDLSSDFLSDIGDSIDGIDIDLDLLSDGAELLVAASSGGSELNDSELAIGAIGLIAADGDFESGACDTIPTDEEAFHEALWSAVGLETNADGTPTTCP